MAEYRAALIPGFGAGPDLVRAMTRAVDETGIEMLYELCDDYWDLEKPQVPGYVADVCRRSGRVVKGPLGGVFDLDTQLYRELGAWALVMPLALPETPIPVIAPFGGQVNLQVAKGSRTAQRIVRELSDGGFGAIASGVSLEVDVVSKQACEKVAAWVFAHAVERGCSTVSVVDDPCAPNTPGDLLAQAVKRAYEEDGAGTTLRTLSAEAALAHIACGADDLGMLVVPEALFGAARAAAGARFGAPGAAPTLALGEGVIAYGPPARALDAAKPCAAGLIRSAALLLWDVGEKDAARKLWASQP